LTHDALRKTPSTVRNSAAVRTTTAAPECRQPRHKIVATRRRNSEHGGARLYMAAGRPMARKSGYSKYTHGAQTHARNLCVKAGSTVHTLPEVTSPQKASDARMLRENTKNRTLGAQNTYVKVMSQCGDRTCLTYNILYIVRFDVLMVLCLRIGTAGL